MMRESTGCRIMQVQNEDSLNGWMDRNGWSKKSMRHGDLITCGLIMVDCEWHLQILINEKE